MPPSSVHLDFHKPDGSLLQVEVTPVPFERRRHLAQVRSWKPILAAHEQQDAPWDWALLKPPKFGGCGTGMISVAIERSRVLGKSGAVGLHSLSGAESFYRNLGFRELGADPAEDGLTYFEIP